MNFQEWTNNQRRVFIDTAQLYEAVTNAFRDSRAYRGCMQIRNPARNKYPNLKYKLNQYSQYLVGQGATIGSSMTPRWTADRWRRGTIETLLHC